MLLLGKASKPDGLELGTARGVSNVDSSDIFEKLVI